MLLTSLQNPIVFACSKALVFPPNPNRLFPPAKTPSPFVVSSSKQDPDPGPPPPPPPPPPPRTKPKTKPRRRGRKSEAEAVEDLVRSTLDRTFSAIRGVDPESLTGIPSERIIKEKEGNHSDDEEGEGEEEEGAPKGRKHVVEEESGDWPVDADVGWGIRASEYFEEHPIRNVVGDDGEEIDWEGELEDGWVKEINCLEWESFAFHPSPLVVLVFQRFTRASDNWKVLKELEGAIKVYWRSKDRLPPRAVKVDINIERDLAYALKVKEGPQILFLRGNNILYREKEIRTADELVQMIAYFYYKARKPGWMD